jgi:hypothetical protein
MDPMVETTAFQPTGRGQTFDAGMMTFGFSYARSFTDKFSAGGTIHFIHEGLAEFSQQTYAVDVGTLYDVGALGMRIGMAISNIGSPGDVHPSAKAASRGSSGSGRRSNLLQHGDQKLLGSFEFSHPPDNAERMNVGAEYSFQKFMYLRGGYNLNYDAEGMAAGRASTSRCRWRARRTSTTLTPTCKTWAASIASRSASCSDLRALEGLPE